jgi:hypothetical protein
MLQEIKNYLDEHDMNYQLISKDGHRIFKMQFGGRNGTMNCIIDVNRDVVLVLAVCNVNTPPNKRPLHVRTDYPNELKNVVGKF